MQSSVLAEFDLAPIASVFFRTPSTNEPWIRSEYNVRLVLSAGIAFDTEVVDAPLVGHHVQCLIGRDILEQCILTYNGPKNLFTLSVRDGEQPDR